MAGNFIVNVPKLKGRENYDDWAFAVENFLILEGLSKCISEVVEADDAKAKAKIILTIDASLYVHIKEATTTVELWKKLQSLFDNKGFARRIGLLRTLISTRLENCDSMASYVNQIVETSQRLRGTGFQIDDQWVGSLLLAGLPEKFSPMIMAIEHSGIAVTTDSIKTKLLDMQFDSGSASAFGASKPNFNRKYSQKPGDKKGIKCFRCKQLGHYQNKCPNAAANAAAAAGEKTSNAFSAVFLSGTFSESDWYIDSGASVHLTARQDWIKNVIPAKVPEIVVANHTRVPAKCSGEVMITTIVGNRKYDIPVNDVLCVPDLTTNLLSVSQLIKNGNSLSFEDNCCTVFNKQKEIVAIADLVNGMYKLNIFKSEKCLLAQTAISGEVWHRRFGHINSDYLNKMQNGLVNGLCLQGQVQLGLKNCKVCCEGKQTRLPFKHKGTRAKKLLELVHTDVCGPMETRSLGGSKYFVVFEDDFSRMAFVYFIKSKDEVFCCFKQFKSMAENQTNQKIKVLRSDNGGEFCSREFEGFLKSSGIIHQKTNAYTPEQNGVSERLNRTIVEKAKCLLFDGGIEKRFWAEAVNTAVYLRNRSLAAGLQVTPYELWSGRRPDVSNLRIFGSPVMVHVPKERRLKWDKKSIKCVLVGYDEFTKGYRVFDPVKNKITTSRDVTIMENVIDYVDIFLDSQSNNLEVSASVGDNDETERAETVETEEVEVSSDSSGEVWRNPDTDDSEENHELPPLRRSERTPKPRVIENSVTYFCPEFIELDNEPTSVEMALSRPDGESWREAMAEELHSFEENEAWELVGIPEGKTVVQCKWVFKRKSDSENKVRYRARLVAKGFTQRPGIDFNETFSPVVRHCTLRLLMALSIKLDLNICHLDVTTAFLNGYLKEDVFMTLPEGYKTDGCENKVLKLKKAIYGLKQSSRAWNIRVDTFLVNLGYNKSKFEPCLYTKHNESFLTIVTVYVDDFFIFSNDVSEEENVKFKLGQIFKIKDLGQIKNCLGMRVTVDKINNSITLDQEKYIDQILRKFNMIDCNTVATPIETNVNLVRQTDTCKKELPYQQLIGSLMYLSVLTRPDISFAVSYLSQFNNCYNESHWKQAKRVLRYLKQTKNRGLKFLKDDADLEGFVDADWGSNSLDRKSYTGFCFKLSGSAVSWESRKQRTVALSSTEAEYMALSEASKEAIYLKNLISEITGVSKCVRLYNDNQSAQKLAVNPIFHNRSKHIDIRHHFIREVVADDLVKLEYLPTADMPADILTKGLSSDKHNRFVNKLGLINLQ